MPAFALLAQVRFEGLTSGFVTDHNRRATDVQREMIRQEKRMANGTMRERFVATKRSFVFNFEDLPSRAQYTVDGYWSGEEILAFYNANRSFTLKLYYSGNVTVQGSPEETVTVMWQEAPNFTIVGRNPNFDLWNMSFTLVEV